MCKVFACKECCKKSKKGYQNIGAYGPCDLCGKINGVTLIERDDSMKFTLFDVVRIKASGQTGFISGMTDNQYIVNTGDENNQEICSAQEIEAT